MILESSYKTLGQITMPPFCGRQKYMHTFDTRRPRMAEGYEDYLESVMTLCEAAGYSGQAHMTVDEKIVQPGMSQRRPGAHVDGRFIPSEGVWGHPQPGWLHYCNRIPLDRMAVIVASSEIGCAVYPGQFEGHPKKDGDCEHMRPQFIERHILPANTGALLSPDCVHESMVFDVPTQRSFLRIALR